MQVGLELGAGLVRLDLAVIDEAEAAAGLTPAVRRIEGKHSRIEMLEGAGTGRAGHFGAEQFAFLAADETGRVLPYLKGAAGQFE